MPVPSPGLPNILLKQCTIDDAPALSALASRTFYDTFTGTCTEADMQHFLDYFYNEARIRTELDDNIVHTWFAELEGTPIGFITFGETPVPFPYNASLKALELNRLYVHKAYKGIGVAQLLMDYYEAYAHQHGYQYLWLGVWEHNHRAQAFYRRYGFTFTGHTHPFPIGDTPQTDEWWIKELKKVM